MTNCFYKFIQAHMRFQLLCLMRMIVLSGLIYFISGSATAAKSENCSLDTPALNEKIESNGAFFGKSMPGRYFNGRDLYDYMNGGADEYLNAGCLCLWVKRLDGPENQHAIIELFEFNNKPGLDRIYAKNAGEQPIAIGEEGSFSGNGYLVFRQKMIFCRILSFNQKDAKQTVELGKTVEEALSGIDVGKNYNIDSGGKGLTMKNNQPDLIVIIGASYARGWDVDTLLGMEVVNKGVGGEQSGEMLARFEKDVTAHNPQKVIIWGFINDIFRSDRSQMDLTVEKAKRNFEQMIELSRRSGIKPILATEVTIRARDDWKEKSAAIVGKLLGKQSYQAYVNEKVAEVNRWIKRYARTNDLLLLDFQAVLSNGEGMRSKEYATADGSHISKKGYSRLTEYTRDTLNALKKNDNL